MYVVQGVLQAFPARAARWAALDLAPRPTSPVILWTPCCPSGPVRQRRFVRAPSVTIRFAPCGASQPSGAYTGWPPSAASTLTSTCSSPAAPAARERTRSPRALRRIRYHMIPPSRNLHAMPSGASVLSGSRYGVQCSVTPVYNYTLLYNRHRCPAFAQLAIATLTLRLAIACLNATTGIGATPHSRPGFAEDGRT